MKKILEKYFSGRLSNEERSILFEKMETDDELKKQFIDIQNNYALAQMIETKNDLLYAEEGLLQLKKYSKKKVIRRNILRISKYAAILLLAVGLFFIAKHYTSNPNKEILYTEYIAPSGLRKEITLSDGTKICLAPSSKIKVPTTFAKDIRLIELDGEALFKVTKDEERPFIVKTDKYEIKVLGTTFMVNSYSKAPAFKASLLEGSVRVYNNTENILLKPGESALLERHKLITENNNNNEIYYLQSGIYQFDNKSLKEIIDVLGKWYNIDIKVSNSELSRRLLTGKFRENDNIETILKAIQQIYPFTYQKSSNNEIDIY